MVLRGEDVATGPAHFRSERNQRLDEHGRLDGHVQRTGDAHADQWLFRRVFVADGHQARHLLLGDVDLLAAPIGQTQVGHFELGFDFLNGCNSHAFSSNFFGIVD
jgi:hypothetical protein